MTKVTSGARWQLGGVLAGLVVLSVPESLAAQTRVIIDRPPPTLTVAPTAPAGAPPTSVRAGATPTSINLKWICPPEATGYEVFATPTGGAQVKLTPTPIGPQCVQDFAVTLQSDPRLPAPTTTAYLSGFNHTGLRNGSEYTYVVRALYANGAMGDAAISARTAAWPVPTNARASATPSSATLSWSATAGAVGYHLLRQLAGEAALRQITTMPIVATSHVDNGLPPNVAFTYVVRAVFPDGAQTDSPPITGQTPPLPAPMSFQARAVDQVVSLSWGAVSGATGYHVFRQRQGEPSFAQITAAPIVTTTFEDRGLPLAQTHRYYVQAVNGLPAAALSVVPGRPVDLIASASRGNPGVSFRWSGTTSAKSIAFTRAPSAAGPFVLTRLASNELKNWATDYEGVVGATNYYKFIFSYETGLVESDVIAVPIGPAPAGITDLTATSPGPGTAVLRWNCAPEAKHYTIMRGKATEAMAWIKDPSTGRPLQITKCEFTDSGLWNDTRYRYQVIANYGDTSLTWYIEVTIAP